MKKHKHSIQLLSFIFVTSTAMNLGYLSAEPVYDKVDRQENPGNIKYPNGIPEHHNPNQQQGSFWNPSIDVRPDPTIQVGPGVIVGPGVFVRGKPMPNPLLKDVLPINHPLLTAPKAQ